MKLGDVSITAVRVIAETLISEGFDPVALLEQYRITDAMLDSIHVRISLSRYMRLGKDAIEMTDKPWLGVLMAMNSQFSHIGIGSWAAITAPTLSDVLAINTRYGALSARNVRGGLFFETNAEGCPVCTTASVAPYNLYNIFGVEYALGSIYRLAQLATKDKLLLQRVDLEYGEPSYSEQIEALFNCPVYYNSDVCGLTFLAQASPLPSRYFNPAMHQYSTELADKELAALTAVKRFSDQVTETAIPLLPGKAPSMEDIAQKLGMASWTLRRKLKLEGTSFHELVDNARKDLALAYIEDSFHSISEISYLLGFSTAANFHRAFKRWTGQNPGSYRTSKRPL